MLDIFHHVLVRAISYGYTDSALLLLQHMPAGVDLDAQSNDQSALIRAMDTGNERVVQALISWHLRHHQDAALFPRSLVRFNDEGQSCLYRAAMRGDVTIVQLLADAGASMNGANNAKSPSLAAALIPTTHIDTLAILIEHGLHRFNIHHATMSYMRLALEEGSQETVLCLLRHGFGIGLDLPAEGLRKALRDADLSDCLLQYTTVGGIPFATWVMDEVGN